MKKNKNKNLIIFYIALFIILVLAALFLSEYIFLTLEQSGINAAFFMPHRIIGSIVKNINHLTIFFSMCLLIIFGGALILNSNNGSNFESDMDYITDTMRTPKAVGQSQHGSSHWLKEKEYGRLFASYDIEPKKNHTISQLIRFGNDDIRVVRKDENEFNKTENNIAENTPSTAEKSAN